MIQRAWRTPRFRRGLTVVTGTACLWSMLLLPAGALAPSIQVRLRPVGPTSTPQGAPFTVDATLKNPTPNEVHVFVRFHLVDLQGGDQAIDTLTWDVTAPPQGSASTRVSLVSSQWFADQGTFELHALIDGQDAGAPLPYQVTPPLVAVPVFEDVTAQSGLDSTIGVSECGGWAAGAAWGDVNGDGSLDLFLPRGASPAQLWMNDGADHFTDEAASRGVQDGTGIGMGAAFADYDNDGDQDLFVADRGQDRLFQNDGTGHFVDVAVQSGVAGSTDDVTAAWGDYDNDGLLDLYVVSNSQCLPPYFYQQDRLLHNEGNGTFTDQTTLLDVSSTFGAGYQAAWFDYDGDGDQDLYVANDDWGPTPDRNHLWRNDGEGEGGLWQFTDVSDQSGTGYFINSMGIGIGDIDRDLDLDFAVSNVKGNVLARNNGNGTFTEVAAKVGVQRPFVQADVKSVTWGLAFADLNLDGFEDLFVAGGSIYDEFNQPNQVFAAAGNGTFLDLSALSGADDMGVGRGIAIADFDRDGLLDVYVVNRNGEPILYHNVTPTSGHWLEVDLTGTASNRDGCGARLTLSAAGGRQLREVFCGSTGLSSGSDRVVHFGLGADTRVDRLTIEWPSGRRQVLRNPAVDRLLSAVEPS